MREFQGAATRMRRASRRAIRRRWPSVTRRTSPALRAGRIVVEAGVAGGRRGAVYRGVLHTLDRVDFARGIARRFGLDGEIVPVKTADVKLLAPRPLRGGLRVDRAAALLRNKPLGIDEALERFRAEWARRAG